MTAEAAAAETKKKRDGERNELGSLHKGLMALLALNRQEALTASELARQLDVSRTSARRILDTLVTAGLIDKVDSDPYYRLAPAAADLSSGLSIEHVLSHVAAPLLHKATQEIGWTLSLVTLGEEDMVLRVTTQKRAAYAMTYFRFGDKIPLSTSRAGKLAMAYLPDARREALFERISRKGGSMRRDGYSTPEEAAGLRERGYYISPVVTGRESHAYAPVFFGDRVPGCLIMRYLISAVSRADLEQRFVPILQDLAANITQQAKAAMAGRKPQWLIQSEPLEG